MTASIIEKNRAALANKDLLSLLATKRFIHNPTTKTTRQMLSMEVNSHTGEIVSIEEDYERFIEDPMVLLSVTAEHRSEDDTSVFRLRLEDRESLPPQISQVLDDSFTAFIPVPK